MGDHDHGAHRDGSCPGCEREDRERGLSQPRRWKIKPTLNGKEDIVIAGPVLAPREVVDVVEDDGSLDRALGALGRIEDMLPGAMSIAGNETTAAAREIAREELRAHGRLGGDGAAS